jgi:alpha-glucosidase
MAITKGETALNHPWWKTAVIYQVYPRSYQDSSGDGVGDLAGITERLPYIADLGATAIWISPFFKSPMEDFGYDVTDHCAVDPLFGTIEDFERLITRAHELGLKILIDLVLSHVSEQHAWFESARQHIGAEWEECFVWASPAEDGGPPNNWLSVFGGPAWTFEPRRGQYYLHNFLTSQPDLNFHHPRVQEDALSIVKFWLERGVDGFRLDTVNFYFHDQELRDNPKAAYIDTDSVNADNPYGHFEHVYDKNRPEVPAFLERLRTLLDSYGERIALGEVGAGAGKAIQIMAEYQAPDRLHLSYAFDLLSDTFTAEHFRRFIHNDASVGGGFWRCVSFSNHDVMRTASRFGQNEATRSQVVHLSNALLLSLRGTPCIYQGEELGLTEVDIPFELLQDPYGKNFWPEFKGRDGCRTPMPWTSAQNADFTADDVKPWLPIPVEHRRVSVQTQQDDPSSALEKTKALIALRHRLPGFVSEITMLRDSPKDMLVFERGAGSDALLFVFNLSPEEISFDIPDAWVSGSLLLSSVAGTRYSAGSSNVFTPWSFQIWER